LGSGGCVVHIHNHTTHGGLSKAQTAVSIYQSSNSLNSNGIDSDRLYTVARTTSNPASKSRKCGCHNGDRYPNFYIPCEAKLFKEDTWICLDYFSDFAKSEFDTRLAANRLRKISQLTSGILRDLLTCAIEAEGITTAQEKVVRASLAALDK
jgi:hypothetical protein